jgi:hypothetical protein
MEQNMTPAGPPEPVPSEPVPSEPVPSEPVPPEPESSRRAGLIALAVLVVAAVAVAAYFVGRSSADTRGAYDRGYARGSAVALRGFSRGAPGYQRIYNTGYQSGHVAGLKAGRVLGERVGAEKGTKVGFERGRSVGALAGTRQGIVSGVNAALGGFTGWQTGDYYIVKLAPGSKGVRLRIDSRKLMDSDKRYAICANDPASVCVKPIPSR